MSAPISPVSSGQRHGSFPSFTAWDWVCVFGVVGNAPLMYLQISNLSAQKHLQFFPLAWGLVIALVYLRGQIGVVESRLRLTFGWLMMLSALLLGLWASWLISPWLSQVALFFLCCSWMLVRLGGNRWTQIVAWLTLLIVTIPLPMGYDKSMIQQLQVVSSYSASALLELANVAHLPRGNVLEIETGELFVDEACSGVDSLYSLIAIALVLTIWQKRSLLISVSVLASVPVWAWLGNALRIFTIAYLLNDFGIDLTQGWPHMLLGLLLFSASFACLSCSLTVITRLFADFPRKLVTNNYFHAVFNRIVRWPSSKSVESKVPKGLAMQAPKLFIVFAICGFVVVGLLSSFALLKNEVAIGLKPIDRASVKALLNEDVLASNFEGLRRQDFAISHRDTGSIFGEHSATWIYSAGDTNLQISLDFRFIGYHHLEECYRLTDYRVLNKSMTQPKGEHSGLQITELALTDELGSDCLLLYVNVDGRGNFISPLGSAIERSLTGSIEQSSVYQVQMFIPGVTNIMEPQKVQFRSIFASAVNQLAGKISELEDAGN